MSKSRKLYTYALPIIIILNGYASGIAGLSIGAIVMNFFNLYALMSFVVNNRKADRFFVRTVGLLFIFILLSLFAYLFYGISNTSAIFINVLKIITWFMGVIFTSSMLFDYSVFNPYYKKFSVICTCYLFLQMISWNSVHIYLPNLFDVGPLHPFYEQYSSSAYVNYLSSIGFGRFSSFYAEPAYYGIMMVIALIIILFEDDMNEELSRKSQLISVLLILGIWLSTSTAAIAFAIFIIAIYFFKTDMKNKSMLLIMLLSIAVLAAMFITNNTLGNFFLGKMTSIGSSGRVGQSYKELNNLSSLQKLFGVGLGNIGIVTNSSYVNEFTGLIMEYGIIGFIVFLWYMIKLYLKERSIALHILIIIYMAAMAQGGYLFNLFGILIFTVALNIGTINNENNSEMQVN